MKTIKKESIKPYESQQDLNEKIENLNDAQIEIVEKMQKESIEDLQNNANLSIDNQNQDTSILVCEQNDIKTTDGKDCAIPNKFDVFWIKVWAAICSFINVLSVGLNKIIKLLFKKSAPIKYVKAFTSIMLIFLIISYIIAPFKNKNIQVSPDIYSDGLLAVSSQQGYDENDMPIYKWGFIDSKQNVKIPFKYNVVRDFKHGVSWAMQEDIQDGANYWYLIDKKDKNIRGLKILQGDNVLAVGEFSDDTKLAWVFIDNKYKYVKTNGKFAFDRQFDDCGDFYNGLAGVKLGNVEFYINAKGKQIGEDYEQVRDFNEKLGAVKKNNLWGFIDQKGKIAIAIQYDWVSDFVGNYAKVKRGATYGIVDTKGNEVVPIGHYVDI